jgi:hypothetical protein
VAVTSIPKVLYGFKETLFKFIFLLQKYTKFVFWIF